MAETKRARQLRQIETWAEKLMWRWLRRRFSGYKFRRQYPLGNYYLDFFCAEAELNIELDGCQPVFPISKSMMRNGRNFAIARHQDSAILEFTTAPQRTIHPRYHLSGMQKRAPHPLPDYTKPMEPEKQG